MIERIFHLRTRTNEGDQPDTRGGATVVIRGAENDVGFVDVSVVICHPRDTFNKKIGRELALKQFDDPAKEGVFNIPVRFLPQELGAIQRRIYKSAKVPPIRTNFLPAILNFLPKE